MSHTVSTKISIVIPVLNEGGIIGSLLEYIGNNTSKENIQQILVVDGGSTDSTVKIAKKFNAKVLSSKRGRAAQMNVGANYARGTILYFLHADTIPPKGFDKIILNAYSNGHETGCFRMRFDTKNIILRSFAYLSRVNHTLCRGGDQSLFISKSLFEKQKGFNENYLIYEDSEFIRRVYKATNFIVLPQKVITSARKYREKGWLSVQYHFGIIHLKNYYGAGPKDLYQYYSKHLI
ncbi:TIGR04283 family arsenosugar biosynthesis glycosyltransferase [Croceitalea rosinachiae]|uniref:TIGR04283 family arsenosugar biosynthesis glycosyltransferase n=1 Tax=Croceitalea rosinachiae TaxID=3075596 RepID=A0ABU3ACU8_9FLAO|nr:TIGR04283 family arsenosugar biosynthesis glycosyltransferase [Croceitalea sp. F388]MDT0606736.1 TIGR04283 family arsenosugar biosynthesis glycosyltransferase [Croceitalea sp. F388]